MYYKIFITIKVLILSDTSHNQDFLLQIPYMCSGIICITVSGLFHSMLMVGTVGMDIMENVVEVPQKIKDIIMSHLTSKYISKGNEVHILKRYLTSMFISAPFTIAKI